MFKSAKKELVGVETPRRTLTWAIFPGDAEKEPYSMSQDLPAYNASLRFLQMKDSNL